MARPKRIEGQKTARERMEDAFWEMLREMPYHKMTSREVCARSGVSHNSFYYHFENMDDMARKTFDGILAPELPMALLAMVGGDFAVAGGLDEVPDLDRRLERMRLLAGSGSAYLLGLLRDEVQGAWLQAVGVGPDELTEEDRIDLTFVLGGILALLASGIEPADSAAFASFAEREIGRGVVRTMASLGNRHALAETGFLL